MNRRVRARPRGGRMRSVPRMLRRCRGRGVADAGVGVRGRRDPRGHDKLEEYPGCVEEALTGRVSDSTIRQAHQRGGEARAAVAALTLSGLHDIGIVHRDVKPANLVLMGNRFRLVDFGAAADPPHGV